MRRSVEHQTPVCVVQTLRLASASRTVVATPMDVFGSRLRASEGSYHKQRAEEDIKRLADRRARANEDGVSIAGGDGDGDVRVDARTSEQHTSSSAAHYVRTGSAQQGGVDKLAAVYAEELRLFGTATADTRVLRREVSDFSSNKNGDSRDGVMATASSTSMAAASSSIFAAQTMRLNRRDWLRDIGEDLERHSQARQRLTGVERHALETSQRAQKHALVAGLRALGYGTALAVVGVVCGSAAASAYLSIDSSEAFARAFRAQFSPYVDRARAAGDSYKSWVHADSMATTEDVSSRIENSDFVQRLRRKLNRDEQAKR